MKTAILIMVASTLVGSGCTRSGSGGFGSKHWSVQFTMPAGWAVAKVNDGSTLEVNLIDPAFKAPADKVLDEKAQVRIRLSRFDATSPKGKAAATNSIAAVVGNSSFDGLTKVMPRHRASYSAVTASGVPMMRGPGEVHMGSLNLRIDQAIGFTGGNSWIEISGRSEQGNAAAAASVKAAMDTVLASLDIKHL